MQKFVSNSDYTFFAHSVLQQLNINSQVNIAMRKLTPSTLTTGTLTQNF